jgi:hypothetical protein
VNSKLLKLLDEKFVNVQRKMEGVPYKVRVCNGGHEGRCYNCGKYSEPIHVEGQSPHWIAVKCIMRYLKGSLDFKLCLGSKDIILRGFCNADWVGDTNDR